MATQTTRDQEGPVQAPSKDDDVPPPVTERSVPKPVFTDAEAGAKEFPSSAESELQLLHAGQATGHRV